MTTNATNPAPGRDDAGRVPNVGDTVTYRDSEPDGYLRAGIVTEVRTSPVWGVLLTLAHPTEENLRWVERWDSERMTVTHGQGA